MTCGVAAATPFPVGWVSATGTGMASALAFATFWCCHASKEFTRPILLSVHPMKPHVFPFQDPTRKGILPPSTPPPHVEGNEHKERGGTKIERIERIFAWA
eukprot:scaffold350_cov333-Pavlova_lutheri.AAC.43